MTLAETERLSAACPHARGPDGRRRAASTPSGVVVGEARSIPDGHKSTLLQAQYVSGAEGFYIQRQVHGRLCRAGCKKSHTICMRGAPRGQNSKRHRQKCVPWLRNTAIRAGW